MIAGALWVLASLATIEADFQRDMRALQRDVDALVQLTNSARREAGLRPLRLDPQLSRMAMWFARHMATTRRYAHEDVRGRGLEARMADFGLPWVSIGENIAKGFPTPERVFQGWMESKGHHSNLMNPAFDAIGIGIGVDREGRRYWVQDFLQYDARR